MSRLIRRVDHAARIFQFLAHLFLFAALVVSLQPFSAAGDIPLQNSGLPRPISEIPFKAYQTYLIVVDGRIGTREHQNLLLDTGSNPSMIDRSVSADLELKGISRDLSAFNKSVASESVVLSDLEFGPLRRRNLQVMVADFSAIDRELGTRIDAVVGLDVLGGTNFTIDYQKSRISFGASRQPHTAPLIAERQYIAVNLKNGGRQLHLLLDTGTPQLVLFENHLDGADFVWSNAVGSGHNISGNVHFATVVLTDAKIGKENVGPQRASVVSSRKELQSDLDGLMGLSCLRPKRISFDFEHQTLGWSE
jgi:predicted aspartyl protease